MPRFRTIPVGLLLGCVVASAGRPCAAQTRDVAEWMPRDTLLYVGWAGQADQPGWPAQRRLAETLFSKVVQSTPGSASLRDLVELVLLVVESPGGIGLFDVSMGEAGPDVQAALVLAGGERTQRIEQTIDRWLASGGIPAPEPLDVRGVAFRRLAIPDSPFALLWGAHKGAFIVALGPAAAEKVVDALNGSAPPLTQNEELAWLRARCDADLRGMRFCAFADLRGIVARGLALGTAMMGPPPPQVSTLLEQAGILALRSKYVHADSVDGSARLTAFVRVEGEPRGLLTLWQQKPLTDADLSFVPHDAYWMCANNLDLKATWDEIVRVAGAVEPSAASGIQSAVMMSAQMIGFSLTEQLLPALGDTWTIFDAPSHGGLLLTGTVLVNDPRDPEALHGMLSRAVEFAAPLLAQHDVRLALRESSAGGHTLHTVTVGGLPVPVAPTWAFVDGRFVLGLYPQTVRAALRQFDPATRSATILEQPDFKAARARLPKELLGVNFVDSRYFATWSYGAALPLVTALSSFGAGGEDPAAPLDFPTLAEALEGVRNMVGASSREAEGIRYVYQGDLASPVLSSLPALSLPASILLPSISRARELAKRSVSGANLRAIGQGCFIYAQEHDGRLPDRLEALVEAGMISEQALKSPRDPSGGVSYVYVSGLSLEGPPWRLAGVSDLSSSQAVLAYERIIGDEGTNVLFCDAHVEWLHLPEFKERLRDTYRALGREDELPAELAAP